jgi:type IV secretory pathway component VirB8
VYEKKGRCFWPSAQKSHIFRPQQSNSNMDGKVKLYYKVWTNIYIIEFNSRLQFFAKIMQIYSKLYTGRHKRKLQHSNLRNALRIVNLRHRHPADKQWYKVKLMIKIKANNKYLIYLQPKGQSLKNWPQPS